MTLEGAEVAVKIAGAGAKNIAVLLYSVLKEEKKTKGKARLSSMLRSGRELKVFTVRREDLKTFTKEARKYGVLYCVLQDRNNREPGAEVDVIARAEDASKINRVVEKFHLAMVRNGSVAVETNGNSTRKEGNPFRKETEKSPPSGHGFRKSSSTEKAGSTEEKPSVKEELRTIRENRNSTGREKRSPKQRTGKWKSGKAKRGR